MKYKYSDRVEPRIIQSPYDGSPVKPKLITKTIGKIEITEAHWICPTTGMFIRKGTVEAKKKS
tara:strand:+ start:465 stop:653 length:189 start_codon:yes stop_codon:yes gene_type:complete